MKDVERIEKMEQVGNRLRESLEASLEPGDFPNNFDEQAARATCAEWGAITAAGRALDAEATTPQGDEEFGSC
jgi:hypothetical protein